MDIYYLVINNRAVTTIDDKWSIWKNSVLTAVKEFIPTKHVNPRRLRPWITLNIIHLTRKKVITRKRCLSRSRTQVKKAIEESRESFFHSLGSILRNNSKRFWSIFKIKSNSRRVPNLVSTSVIAILKVDHMLTRYIVLHRCFNEYFHSVQTSAKEESSSTPRSTQPASFSPLSSISSINLSIQEVCHALQNIDSSKAHGLGGLPSRILKECAHQLPPSLYYLFTKSLKIPEIPVEWKLANIITIYKKGTKNHVKNFNYTSAACGASV